MLDTFAQLKRRPGNFLEGPALKISYSELAKDLEDTRHSLTLHSGLGYVLEAKNTYSFYLKFLACLAEGRPVFACAPFQFSDPEFRSLFAHETSSQFCFVSQDAEFNKAELPAKNEMNPRLLAAMAQKSPVFVVRTSGTSGKKYKFILHDATRFETKFLKRRHHYVKTMAFSPAESIAGIETLLECIVHGKTLVCSGEDMTPEVATRLLSEFSVDYFQTIPTFLNLLLFSRKLNPSALPALREIAFGSEPSSPRTLSALQGLLPGISFRHTYGMSEIGILATITPQNEPGLFLPDEAKNPFRIQEDILEVQSETLMLGYLNFPNTKSEWFSTGDIAEESGGFLRILGRKEEICNVAGRKFFPAEVEELIRKVENVADVTIVIHKNELVGQVLEARIVLDKPEEDADFMARFRAFTSALVPSFMIPPKITLVTPPAGLTKKKRIT